MSTSLDDTLRADVTRSRRGRRPGLWAASFVVVVTLLANVVYLLRLRSNNPMLYTSGLGSPTRGSMDTSHTIDPNDGWTAQTLGHLSADLWTHGKVPLWNVYEGLGQPLAGEMQSAALFLPFVLLQRLPNGIFLMHLALELVAGLTMLWFLRSLRLSWVAAAAGGCLFALNGAFAVMTNAPFNPIAFLPMALWGVELTRRAVAEGRRPIVGPWVLALAVAWMLYAGFPETALLELMFVACWAAARVVQDSGRRRALLVWGVGGVIAGLVLALPILVAFKDFLSFGTTAYHEEIANSISYPPRQLASLAFPFGAGPMSNKVFGLQAGYITLPAVLVAIVGCFGRRDRGIRVLLVGTVVVLVANMFDGEPIKTILNHTPGVANVLTYKYGLVLIEIAVAILAAYGIDDLARRGHRRRHVAVAAGLTACWLGGCLLFLHHGDYLIRPLWTTTVTVLTFGACLALALVMLAPRDTARTAAGVALAVLTVDAAVTYAVPQLGASVRRPVDTAPITFLQDHIGTSRFYTLGPIQPDYGSYWRLAQLNVNDLPVAKKYADFVMNDIRPRPGTPGAQGAEKSFKSYQLVPFNFGPAYQKRLLLAYGQQQHAFRDAGVKYVVMAPGVTTPEEARRYGLSKVFSSPKTEIYEDAEAAPYYATSGGACTVGEQSLTEVTLTCSGPATLTRRQLSSPGWTASVNGAQQDVKDEPSALFQSMSVPQGTSHITFDYRPRYWWPAVAASLAVVVLLVVDLGWAWVRGRRRRRELRGEEPV